MMTDDAITLQNLILDMDGVLWRGETPMPGLNRLFETLRACEINFVLATNNATRVATQYTEKLQRFGVDVPPEAILTSAEATAAHLRDRFPGGARAYVVGEVGLQQAMRQNGFHLIPDDDNSAFIASRVAADVVVVGFTRYACYEQLAAAVYLVNNGALFVGTNPDVTFPHEVGPLPGAGAYLAFIEAATGCAPVVIGKPGRAIFDEAVARLRGSPQTTAMVGDRLETDIIGAQAAGLRTILLLSGVTPREKLAASEIVPDLVMENIEELTRYIRARNGHAIQSHDV